MDKKISELQNIVTNLISNFETYKSKSGEYYIKLLSGLVSLFICCKEIQN